MRYNDGSLPVLHLGDPASPSDRLAAMQRKNQCLFEAIDSAEAACATAMDAATHNRPDWYRHICRAHEILRTVLKEMRS